MGKMIIVKKHERGVPIVKIIPYREIEVPAKKIFGTLKKSITINKDLIAPIGEKWNAEE